MRFSEFSAVRAVKQLIFRRNSELLSVNERLLMIQAQLLAKQNRSIDRLREFAEVEFSAYSQWGEDGILDWLISALPGIPNSFVEFGVENYRESNTRFLLRLNNWRGLVIDGSRENIHDVCQQDVYWRHELAAKCAFVRAENINELLEESLLDEDVGVLSIDVDGNDFWIWKAIHLVSPAIVVVEYNAVFGDRYQLTIPYQPDFQREIAHYSNLYFGASLAALIRLGGQKGYDFVGTNSAGNNAFFVRQDLSATIRTRLPPPWAYPSMFRESRGQDLSLNYLSGSRRVDEIKDLPLVDPFSGETLSLEKCGECFSEEWLAGERRAWL